MADRVTTASWCEADTARTHDYAFLNIALNIVSSFPYVAAINRSNLANAFTLLQSTPAGVPPGTDPNQLTRTVVAEDFRAPLYDQFSLGAERQLGENLAVRVGYVGTFGNDLFQTLDGNPRLPFSTQRQDPTRGVIRLRANTAESWYHSLQTQLDKRFSRGLSAGVHYTWSRFEDTASEIFNPSAGEVAVAQDSFNPSTAKEDAPPTIGRTGCPATSCGNCRGEATGTVGGRSLAAGRSARSSPAERRAVHRVERLDPTGALAGIDGLVGNAIRPNLNTDLDLSSMTVNEILAAGGASLFRPLCGNPSPTCAGERVGQRAAQLAARRRRRQHRHRDREEHQVRERTEHPDSLRDVQRDEHAELRHPGRADQLGELPIEIIKKIRAVS